MKNRFTIPLVALVLTGLTGNAKEISKEAAWQFVYDSIIDIKDTPCTAWMQENEKEWTVIVTTHPDSESFYVYDYYFVPKEADEESITTQLLWQSFPQGDVELIYNSASTTNPIKRVISNDDAKPSTPIPEVSSNPNMYAVIISGAVQGDINKGMHGYRFFADCQRFYNVLRKNYSVPKENIHILFSDGNDSKVDIIDPDLNISMSTPLDWDNDGINDLELACTRANIEATFDKLGQIMTANDDLIVFVDGHGGYDSTRGSSYVKITSGYPAMLYADDFNDYLSRVTARYVTVVMEPCHSGGFITATSRLTRPNIITTACSQDEDSQSTRYKYDSSIPVANEFIYHWTKAFTRPRGGSLYGDYNGDGYVSFKEAYQYAKDNDIFANGTWKDTQPENIDDSDLKTEASETPRYKLFPALLESTLGLYPRYVTISPFSNEKQSISVESTTFNSAAKSIEVALSADSEPNGETVLVTDFFTGETIARTALEQQSTNTIPLSSAAANIVVVTILDTEANIISQSKLSVK